MVKYGMTPMQAIQAATINAATLIGKPEQFGSLSAGKFADIIALPWTAIPSPISANWNM